MLEKRPTLLPTKDTQPAIATHLPLLPSKMLYNNSLQNTSIDLTNGNGPETPSGSPDSVDGPWLPPLPDSPHEEDPHW